MNNEVNTIILKIANAIDFGSNIQPIDDKEIANIGIYIGWGSVETYTLNELINGNRYEQIGVIGGIPIFIYELTKNEIKENIKNKLSKVFETNFWIEEEKESLKNEITDLEVKLIQKERIIETAESRLKDKAQELKIIKDLIKTQIDLHHSISLEIQKEVIELSEADYENLNSIEIAQKEANKATERYLRFSAHESTAAVLQKLLVDIDKSLGLK